MERVKRLESRAEESPGIQEAVCVKNATGIQKSGRKSDTVIVSKKSVKADGEKSCAFYSFR